jgi:hypothetical protein
MATGAATRVPLAHWHIPRNCEIILGFGSPERLLLRAPRT